jgi:hypothetical protein
LKNHNLRTVTFSKNMGFARHFCDSILLQSAKNSQHKPQPIQEIMYFREKWI